MDFRQTLDYLLSLGNEVSAMKLGLENIRKLLAALGDPHTKYFKVQVAGTNGKGSVCAFLNSICVSAGIKIGMFTSPHLVSITERIQINGGQISEAEFAKYATRVRNAAEELVSQGRLDSVPTFFEQVTAIALVAFAEKDVELAILETGLGGRLDATTAADAEIAVITRIDIDHQEYLGETLEEIAAEKAAIIHPESAVVVGAQRSEAMKVILDRCRELTVVPKTADTVEVIHTHNRLKFQTGRDQYQVEKLGINGNHQTENAKTALLTAEILQTRFPIQKEHIVKGLDNAKHPGRLEFAGRFVFDGAHNAGGAKALRSYLDDYIDVPITMIFGAMHGKDVREMARILFPKADTLVLTSPANTRSMTADQISQEIPDGLLKRTPIHTTSVAEALSKADEHSQANSVILVTGSLYLVGEVKKLLSTGQAI